MSTLEIVLFGLASVAVVGCALFLSFMWLIRIPQPHIVDANGNVVPGPAASLFGGNFKQVAEFHEAGCLSQGIETLQRKFDAHPYMGLHFPGNKIVVAGCPEAAKVILSGSHAAFPKSPKYEAMESVMGNGLVTANGDLWKHHRALMNPAFHADNLKLMVDCFSQHAMELAAIWSAQLENEATREIKTDFHVAMATLTADIICDAAFGYRLNAKSNTDVQLYTDVQVMLQEMSSRFRELFVFTRYLPTQRNRRFRESMGRINGLIDSIIEQRLKELHSPSNSSNTSSSSSRRTDLLDLVLASKDSETGRRMSDQEIRAELITFFGAGHETTANLLSWTMYELGQSPVVIERMQAEIDRVLQGRVPSYADINNLDYLNMVIKESLRLHPPVGLIGRDMPQGANLPVSSTCSHDKSNSDSEHTAYSFGAQNTHRIMIPIRVLHRDPDLWEQADSFIPERWSPELTPFKDSKKEKNRHQFAFVPFSAGPRACIGQRFALFEAAAILAILFQRFSVRLLSQNKIDDEEAITVRPKGGVAVTITSRSQSS